MGFAVAPPYICTAAELGAGHLRRRVFVLAWCDDFGRTPLQQTQRRMEESEESIPSYRDSKPRNIRTMQREEIQNTARDAAVSCNSQRGELWEQPGRSSGESREGEAQSQEDFSTDAASIQCDREASGTDGPRAEAEISSDAAQPKRRQGKYKEWQATRDGFRSAWWASEPGLERLVLRFPNRLERDRALGNAVVPIVAAKAFAELVRSI